MEGPVKRRPYDNSRRQANVRATRAEIIAAARRLFIERGYPATTVEAIGEASAIPLATVYRLFGSKRGILAAVLDVSLGGDDEPIAFGDRPAIQAALAESDPHRLLTDFARICRALLDRSAPILHALAGAASVDPEAAEYVAITAEQRLQGQSRIAHALAERDALASCVGEADAADIIYLLMSPEVYRILTVERRWSGDQYEHWLATALCAMLLPEPKSTIEKVSS
jgi:AcrR family transcriptional regulator